MNKYVKRDNIQIEKLSDEFMEDVLVINNENDSVLVLNYTAGIILNKLESPLSLEEILDFIIINFEDIPEYIEDEIVEILKQFERDELISITE